MVRSAIIIKRNGPENDFAAEFVVVVVVGSSMIVGVGMAGGMIGSVGIPITISISTTGSLGVGTIVVLAVMPIAAGVHMPRVQNRFHVARESLGRRGTTVVDIIPCIVVVKDVIKVLILLVRLLVSPDHVLLFVVALECAHRGPSDGQSDLDLDRWRWSRTFLLRMSLFGAATSS